MIMDASLLLGSFLVSMDGSSIQTAPPLFLPLELRPDLFPALWLFCVGGGFFLGMKLVFAFFHGCFFAVACQDA